MVDLSALSDEDLAALSGGDLSSLSDDGLAIVSGRPSESWSPIESAMQFGAGAIEGTAGLIGLAADLNPLQYGGPKFDFPVSKIIKSGTDAILPAEEEKYRYARTGGQFIGPGGAMGAAGKGFKAAGKGGAFADWLVSQLGAVPTSSAITGALGAQASEDLTGNSDVVPFLTALATGSIPSLINSARTAGRSIFRGSTPAEIKGSAAAALREQTGLSADDISGAIEARPADVLGDLMTTAEVTKNPGMAQLQQELTSVAPGMNQLGAREARREAVRIGMLDDMSQTKGITPEAIGASLATKADDVRTQMEIESGNAWSGVPRNVGINVSKQQGELGRLLNARQGGLEPGSKVRTLVTQFLNDDPNIPDTRRPIKTSGALQDIRSDALALSRDANLSPFEQRILGSLQGNIDDAMSKGLKGQDYDAWKVAREATRKQAETFSRNTAGGSILNENAKPYNILDNALKGDAQSVRELKAAVRSDPAVLEDVKRGVLDRIKLDAKDKLTPGNVKKFLDKNRAAIGELFSSDHLKAMERILDDLQSSASVQELATLASKGQSPTAQRTAAASALRGMVLGKIVPGTGKLGAAIEAIQSLTGTGTKSFIDELLLRASFEPKFALELAKTPTTERVLSLAEMFTNALTSAAESGARAATLEAARTEGQSQPVPQQGQSAGARSEPKSQQQPQSPERRSVLDLGSASSFQNSAANSAATQPPDLDLISSILSPDSEDLHVLAVGGDMDEMPKSAEVRPAKVAEVEAQIDADPIDAAIYEVESSRNPKAKNPNSTASGGFQLIKQTAKALGVKDVFDLADNYQGYKKLRAENEERFKTSDPLTVYAAHFLGAPLLDKWRKGKALTNEEAAQVKELREKALPRFKQAYENIIAKKSGSVEA